jgi:hypothetical protein
MMAFQGARRMNKQEMAILSLPEHPANHIYWIVYNHDMVEYTKNLIQEIRGPEYMSHVTVVAKSDPSRDRTRGSIYFDPTLMDLIGNGGYG